MKNKLGKGLSLSANPISLNKCTFFASTKVFTEFFDKISKLFPRPLRAGEQRSVAYSNKVMDTRLPQPVGCGDKHDVDCWCFKRLFNVCCKFFKHPSPDTSVSTSPARGAVKNNILSKGLDVVRQYAALLERGVQCSTRERKVLVETRQTNPLGRSMIEMLGVLAIIGILSVGGIAGYSKAMMKFKINKVIDEYNSFIFGLLEHKDSLYKLTDGTGYADIANSLNIFPQTWTYTDARFAKDSMEQTLQMWKASGWIETNPQDPTLIFETYFNNPNISKYYESVQTLHLCRALFSDFAVPSAGVLKFATLWRNTPSTADIYWHGNATCTENTPCLKNLTVTQIDEQCRTCADTKGSCTLLIGF